MRYVYLDLYPDFKCLADRCSSTCCAGWKIVIDEESIQRFQNMEPEWLRRDILEHIDRRGDEYRFCNQKGGRCSMLDTDGLCRIQRNSAEDQLCITCRKFPRLTGEVQGEIWISMAASCPVVAEYLWHQTVGLLQKEPDGKAKPLAPWSLPVVREGMERFHELQQDVLQLRAHEEDSSRRLAGLRESAGSKESEGLRESADSRESAGSREQEQAEQSLRLKHHAQICFRRYETMLDLIDLASEVLLQMSELTYLEGSFDYFEDECTAAQLLKDLYQFETCLQPAMEKLAENYLVYRLYSRYLEYPSEPSSDRLAQALGEYALIYLISFSRFHNGWKQEASIVDVICWVYRFCAHGCNSAAKLHTVFREACQTPTTYVEVGMPDEIGMSDEISLEPGEQK